MPGMEGVYLTRVSDSMCARRKRFKLTNPRPELYTNTDTYAHMLIL